MLLPDDGGDIEAKNEMAGTTVGAIESDELEPKSLGPRLAESIPLSDEGNNNSNADNKLKVTRVVVLQLDDGGNLDEIDGDAVEGSVVDVVTSR